ncbi:MAG: nitrate reductase subunit alpha [Chloroflexota bacterium]
MNWIQDLINPRGRQWEEFYRNRWQHDRVVRSTHGVNCTGGCSWMVYVKDGIITWEMQATDYPSLATGLPPYEPRGCQRGMSFSWYIYSPIRVKHPYIRGALVDMWREARGRQADPVAAWASIVENDDRRKRYQQARGKGGFRRATWDEVLEVIAASVVYTVKKHGPDRVVGFSPIPAMSMLSYAGGSRFLQLLGGVNLSFYDWYSDLPNASPEVWGEQTDVCESADWYNSKYIVVMGANLNMTRTPDVHFVSEARHAGCKLVVLSPDLSQVSKYADWWLPINAGQDGAFWMATNHVILKEFHHEQQTPYFLNYLKRYTDAPFLVVLRKKGECYVPDRLLRAHQLKRYQEVENADWKFLVMDKASGEPRLPQGAIGFRWQTKKGQWNLEMKDGVDGLEIEPLLTFLDDHDEVLQADFPEFALDQTLRRGVPVKYVETTEGRVPLTTIYDLLMAQFGIERGLEGQYPKDYDDEGMPYTPAWQEKFTGIDRGTVVQFAREWASTAEKTRGQCMIIIGAGINHWYHNNLIYRAGIVGLMLCGCVGRNGGGLNHYVGQEKLAPVAPWTTLAFALDWVKPPRLQNTPSFHYVHSDQWRYERAFTDYQPVFQDHPLTQGHTMDVQAKAVRMGWLPFYPQFNRNSIDLVKEAEEAGARDNQEVVGWVVQQLKEGKLRFSVQDPDAPENWPRLLFIWRGNALMSSAKGHEYFLKHYLGTHTNAISEEIVGDSVKEVILRGRGPRGKLDLVVDINFRMDTSALYSDIVLPTATWYEKDDLNSTDLHSYIHPLSAAVPPCWESRSDWDIFKAIAKRVSEVAQPHLPGPVKDLVATPLMHDTAAEMAQPSVKDWAGGECEPLPGKTMPNLAVVERSYVDLFQRFISFGPVARRDGIGAHGITWSIQDFYDEMLDTKPVVQWNGQKYPSLDNVVDAANIILHLAPETNGEVAYRAFKVEEAKVGLPLADLADKYRGVEYGFADLLKQPRRLLTSPCWSGISNDGRAYAPYCMNVERQVPWRTLTGRQHFYLDHEGYLAFGEHLPTYKPRPDPRAFGDIARSQPQGNSILLNYLTPHGKWHIHSTYFDNLRMLTLSRGVEPLWMNNLDAEKIGVRDNDWVEVYNDHGTVVTRAVVSSRIPRGLCIHYHSPERTISVPKSPLRGNRRAGGHNSLTRTRLKPVLMMGGYAQFTYAFNYWGPVGVNRDTFIFVKKLEGPPRW